MPPAATLREVLTGQQAAKHGALPKLLLPGDDALLSPFITDAASFIAANLQQPHLAPHLYRRDVVPVIPIPGTRRFTAMKPEYFVSWAERHFAPYKIRYDKNGDPFDIVRPMTKEVGRACLESIDLFVMKMPNINRTLPIPAPVIPDDGGPLSLCQPGFNPETGMFVFDADFAPDPEYLAKGDGMVSSGGFYDDRLTLTDAVHDIYSLLCHFPFSDWEEPFAPAEDHPFHRPDAPGATIRLSRSLSVQLMAMLAMFAGACVPARASRLGFAFNANKQRSGKTLLGKIITAIVHGNTKLQSWRDSDEDMIKLLDAETLAATSYIFFDNVRSLIASAPLEGFMTSATWTGRVLGVSQMFEAENNALILVSGNNASFGPDMQERLLIVDLYVESADRQDRGVDIPREHRLDDVWLSKAANRRRVLSDLWAIVRHWDAAGRPRATGSPRRGFEEWCEILAGMVEFAGFGDPLVRPANLENCGDSETDDIRALVEFVSAHARAVSYSFQQIVHICWEKGLLPWCLHGKEDYSEELQKPSLILDAAHKSRLGLLLQRNCSGERGEVHKFRLSDSTTRHVRFYSRGKGRSRRYHFDEVTPS